MRRLRPLLFASLIACTSGNAATQHAGPVPSAPSTIPPSVASAAPAASLPDAESSVVRFAALGDTGSGEAGQREVARALATKCASAGCDFVTLLGDNLYPSGASSSHAAEFESRFEVPYRDVATDFFAVLGNHDYGHGGLGTDFARGQNEVDYSKVSQKWKMPAAYYKVERGPLLLVGTDTNMQMFGRDDAQRRDVKEWLTTSTAKWRIVLGHHPYLSNGPHGNAGSYNGAPMVPIQNGARVKSFYDDVICGNADLHLSGHDHSRQWMTETCKGTEFAVSGSGATSTTVSTANKTRFQSAGLGFLYITVDPSHLHAEFVNSEGVTEFTRDLSK